MGNNYPNSDNPIRTDINQQNKCIAFTPLEDTTLREGVEKYGTYAVETYSYQLSK